ncbi:RES domain-containing protein [Austwickia chelonae]|uniref:RES domain-containing protein n=1 Tax=Austwickia chelonae NBRC 105200 TaxID=1184607 RepID=K6WAB2_9MICO|nr:RES family NAD+ phosphorylase [Austwickia chelonae]GAB78777.1 hypothetical protein AUCHE_16_02000 [Austwickia chelonae NBRC 105200]SEW35364.1 RES domain-containing protein [Austwickia chelonae]
MITRHDALWRVHRLGEAFLIPWNTYRESGPVAGMRWDPHPQPEGAHPGYGVLYAATCPEVCLAESFQSSRTIHLSTSRPYLIVWMPTRGLRLLDLLGPWPLRHGASASLHTRPKRVCRTWAAAIHDLTDPLTGDPLDGFVSASTMHGGGHVVVLFDHAADSMPRFPGFSMPLSDPFAAGLVQEFATSVDWPVVH